MPLHPFAPHLCDDVALANCIIAAMPLLQGKSFLEVGCGNGYFCGYAHSRYASPVVGIDETPHAILDARHHFSACDFRATASLPHDRFDVVLMRAPLPDSTSSHSHDSEDTFQLALSRLMARLRPGGLLLLQTPLVPQLPQSQTQLSYRKFSQRLPLCDWRKEGSASGQTIISIRHRSTAYSLPPAACLQLAQRYSA